MKYIIIGLGNYGHMLAEELSVLGHEVIGADVSASRVDSIKEKIATAFVLDATDEQALAALPLSGVDVVIVALIMYIVPYLRLLVWNGFLLRRKMQPVVWCIC